MSWLRKHPQARGPFFARWKEVWTARLATGAVSPDEEEAERRELMQEVAGVDSSNKLTKSGFSAVMMAMAIELNAEKGEQMRDPDRASRIYKIEKIAEELRPDNPESYIVGTLSNTTRHRNLKLWRTSLDFDEIHNLMLTMISQQRREGKKGAE